MASKPECIDCGTIYDVRRWKLGYNICLDCGQTHAEQKRQSWCVAPIALDKLLKSKNRITMTTSFGNSNKCTIKKKTDKEYRITIENNFMKNNETVSSVLVDYEGSSWIIEKQSFYPDTGKVVAFLKLENISRNNIDIKNFSILYLDGEIAKRTIGCPS